MQTNAWVKFSLIHTREIQKTVLGKTIGLNLSQFNMKITAQQIIYC